MVRGPLGVFVGGSAALPDRRWYWRATSPSDINNLPFGTLVLFFLLDDTVIVFIIVYVVWRFTKWAINSLTINVMVIIRKNATALTLN